MSQLIASSLLVLASISADSTRRCSAMVPSLSQLETRNEFVVLEATPDSVGVRFAYNFYWTDPYSRSVEPDGITSRAETVFGQVFRVRAISGPASESVAVGATVLVIWWELGMSCQRARPLSATKSEVRELFLVGSPRARTEWAGAVPIFDASLRRFLFSPQLLTPRPYHLPTAPAALSMEEFLGLLRVLPRPADIFSQDSAAIVPLLEWADADTTRWHRFPSNFSLCEALAARERLSSRCRQLMNLPSDTIVKTSR